MMMEYVAIMTLKENMMETSPKSVEQHELFVYIDFSNHLKIFYATISFLLPTSNHNKPFIMFLPPTSILEPIIYPFADKFYPPAILVKHHTWFLPAADLFISINGVLYGVHQSYFDQSPLFQEILQYRENKEINTNPSYPIPFDTLKKEIFNDFLHLLYFGTEQLEYLRRKDWINIKCLSMDWHFPQLTAHIIRQFFIFQRGLLPQNLWFMANTSLVYHIIDEQT
jgi:hypothetical protein